MGLVTVQVSYRIFGEFLDIPGLPSIREVTKDDAHKMATVSIYVEGMADCEAHLITSYREGEAAQTWLVPEIPLADTGARFGWAGKGEPPDNLRRMLRPPWGTEPPQRTGSEWKY